MIQKDPYTGSFRRIHTYGDLEGFINRKIEKDPYPGSFISEGLYPELFRRIHTKNYSE